MKKIISIFAFTILLFSGCSLSLEKNKSLSPEDHAQIGEALLPQDILFLVKFETTDENEYQNFQALQDILIPQESKTKADFFSNLEAELISYDLDYNNDIKPLFGERTQTIIALGGDLEKQIKNQAANAYLIQSIDNLSKYKEITDKLLLKEVITPVENGYQFISFSAGEDAFFGQKNGYIVLSNNLEEFNRMMGINVINSLVYSEHYAKVRENLPETFLGLTYFNLNLLISSIQEYAKNHPDDFEENLLALFQNPIINVVNSLGVSINAEPEGIKILGYTHGNKQALDEVDLKFNEIPNRASYLNKSLPGKGLYLYAEGFDLREKFRQFEENLATNDPDFFELYEEQKKQIKNIIGLDLEKDILTWLDNSVNLTIQNTDKVLPGITFAADVRSNPEGAGKLLDTLDSFLAIAMLSLQEYSAAINKEEIEIGQSTFKQITLLPENLPLEIQEKGDLVVSILSDLKISYGITDNNILIFTTYPDFVEDFENDIVSENIAYKQVKNKIEKKGQGVFYFSPETFLQHLNAILNLTGELALMSPSDREGFEIVSNFFKHFEAFIFTTVAHEYDYELQGYLKIH